MFTTTRLGRGLLVITTIAIVVGVGTSDPSAARASSPATSTPMAIAPYPAHGTTINLAGVTEDGKFAGQVSAGRWDFKKYSTLAEARRNTVTYTVQRKGDHFNLWSGRNCLIAVPCGGEWHLDPNQSECAAEGSLFSADRLGRIRNKATGSYISQLTTKPDWNGYTFSDSRPAIRFPDIEVAFFGQVDSIDVALRTAAISGRADPNVPIIIGGTQEVRTDAGGSWSASVGDLQLGSNVFSIEQWEEGELVRATTLDVHIEVSPVTAVPSFPTERSRNALVTGTAHPGATIVITDDTDTEIARTTAATTPTGPWRTEIPAPGRGGDYTIRIHQEIDGEANGRIDRTLSYGSAVTIQSPVDDMAHDGGPVAMTGRGEIGATVEVREEGRATLLGRATVLSNSTWNLRTTNLDARKHTLVATQTGRGANTTSAAVTLNPEADDTGRDLAVTSHRNGDPFAPSGLTTLRGTATPDSSVTVYWFGEDHPAQATTVPTNSVGDWAASRGLGGTRPYELTITQAPRPGVVDRITGFTLTPPATGPADLTVTSHRSGDPFSTTGVTTLEGRATPDSTITVYWFGTENDTPALTTTTTAGPSGNWRASRGLGGTRPYLVDIRQTPRQPGVVDQIDDLRLTPPR